MRAIERNWLCPKPRWDVSAQDAPNVSVQDVVKKLFDQLGEDTPDVLQRIEQTFTELRIDFEEFITWMQSVIEARCFLVDKMRLVQALSNNKPRELVYGLFMLVVGCNPCSHELVDCIVANMTVMRRRCIKNDTEWVKLAAFVHFSNYSVENKQKLKSKLDENYKLAF